MISGELQSLGSKRPKLANPLDFSSKFNKTTQGFLQSPKGNKLEQERNMKRKVYVRKTDKRTILSPTYDDAADVRFPVVSPCSSMRESDA